MPWAEGLLVALLVAVAVWQFTHRDGWLHDDAFISLRYARHLAQGHGLVFNPGERVEGYTNFLWTAGLAAALRLGLDGPRAAGFGSSIAFLALVAATFGFVARRGGPRALALVPPLVLAAHPLARAESVGGLETPLFALLVWIGFACAASGGDARRAAAAFAAATLVRPEGAGLFAVLLAVQALGRERTGRETARAIALFGLLVAPQIVFRAAYYGDLVPNTYHAKVGWGGGQLVRGARYAWTSWGAILSVPGLALVALGLGRGARRTAAVLLAAQLAYVVAVGGDFAPTGRFLLATLPFVGLLLASGLERVHAALERRGRLAIALPAVCAALAVAQIAVAGERALRARGWDWSYPRDLAVRRAFGTYVTGATPPDWTLALGSIGAVGWYADRTIFDAFGLTNTAIGRLAVPWMGQASAGHEKGDAEAVLARAPEIIAFDRALVERREATLDEFLAQARSPTEQLLVQEPRFLEMYRLRTFAIREGVVHWMERVDARE